MILEKKGKDWGRKEKIERSERRKKNGRTQRTPLSQREEKEKNIRQTQMPKPLPQLLHHLLSDTGLLIKLLEFIPLGRARVASDRRNINHAIPVLDKSAPLDGNFQVGNVVQDPAHQLLVLVLADPLDEGV